MGDAVAWLAGAVNRFSSDRGEDLKHYQRNISRLFVTSFFSTLLHNIKPILTHYYFCSDCKLVTNFALVVMRTYNFKKKMFNKNVKLERNN